MGWGLRSFLRAVRHPLDSRSFIRRAARRVHRWCQDRYDDLQYWGT